VVRAAAILLCSPVVQGAAGMKTPPTEGEHTVDRNVVEERPREIESLFELAASRLAESWLSTGRLECSISDLRLASEFLTLAGWTVEEVPGVLVRIAHRDGRTHEMTREETVLFALRRLAAGA
jgi:hypothetical protein